MLASDFSRISAWVFDLDNTLYPPEARLFVQIEVRMTAWVARELGVSRNEADRLRRQYWQTYGTTLAGLMTEHGVDPAPYLSEVHEISMDHLTPDLVLNAALQALPGRRIVYTNGSEPYARRVLAARGLEGAFDAVYGVEHADFRPKPERQAFEVVFARDGIEPARAAMLEDDARNLETPFAMGLRTIHVTAAPEPRDFIHHTTDDLAGFLSQVT